MKSTSSSVLSVTPGFLKYHIVCTQPTQCAVDSGWSVATVYGIDKLCLLPIQDKRQKKLIRTIHRGREGKKA